MFWKHSKTVLPRLEPQPFPLNPGGCGGLRVPGRHSEDSGPAPALKKNRGSVLESSTYDVIFSKAAFYYYVGFVLE